MPRDHQKLREIGYTDVEIGEMESLDAIPRQELSDTERERWRVLSRRAVAAVILKPCSPLDLTADNS